MDKRMLINALHREECRIAIVEDDKLTELEIEVNKGRKLKGNVYKAKVSRIEPSLQAAFIDIGAHRNGFLQINDIHPAYFQNGYREGYGKVNIQDVLTTGQDIVVQVVKEERELKGATLTTYISLPGRYVVLMPGSDRGGVSRKISDSEQRRRLRNLSNELEIPTGMGLIIRTAGLDRSQTDLARDLSLQLKLWEKILQKSQSATSPSILYHENDIVTRVVRDYFTPDVRQILIDDELTFKRVREFVDEVMPRYRSRVLHYADKHPIFSNHNIEEQISKALLPEVLLPSGGSIVIEPLEALVAIDVNSGKATIGGSIEETAYRTNLEASDEIARQLKLRDLGGLIVVDFIDMMQKKNKMQVEKRFHQALKPDKARIEIGKISRFGLLEMSRQRLRGSLHSQTHTICSSCKGTGILKDPEITALEALRKIQAAIIVGHVTTVKARLTPSAALFLLNMKKKELHDLEEKYNAHIYIFADGRMRVDEYEFEMVNQKGEAPQVISKVSATPVAQASLAAQGNKPPKNENTEDDDEDEDDERNSEQRRRQNRSRHKIKRIKPRNERDHPKVEPVK